MSQTKFIMSSGLAFSEEKDMDRLRRQSLKGWHVDSFQFMGYSLKKGESKDYIYSLDYRTLASAEENEYFEFFSSAGWSHVASVNIALKMYHPCHSLYHCLPRFLPPIAWQCTKTINISYILNIAC